MRWGNVGVGLRGVIMEWVGYVVGGTGYIIDTLVS